MVKTHGVVVAIKARFSSDSTTFYPTVEFVTAEGEKVRFDHSVSSNPPQYKVGDKGDVLYMPQFPQKAMIDSWDIWLFPIVITIAGALLIVVSLRYVLGLLGKLGTLLVFQLR